MGCTNSKAREVDQFIMERFSDIINKISPEELNVLKIIYFDLALRNSNRKIEKETFFVFFQKNGLWGHRLFKEFDMDNTGFVCMEEFVFSTAKIIKADQDAKIGLLYEFFAFGNKDKNDGIVYSDFLRVLYNYSKQQLISMLQAEYLTDNKLKEELIEVLNDFQKSSDWKGRNDQICLEIRERSESAFESNIYQCLNLNEFDRKKYRMNSLIGKPTSIENFESIRRSERKNRVETETNKENESNSSRVNQFNPTDKDEDVHEAKTKKNDNFIKQSGLFLELNDKKITIKTGSYHALVKKVGGLIFKHFGIDRKNGRLFEDQFVQWIKLHKDLYESYYRGFNQHIWEMKDGKLSYLQKIPEFQSPGKYFGHIFERGEIREKPVLKNCKVFLQGSILFVSDESNKNILYNIIFLEGLEVSQIHEEKSGHGIQINHKNNIYQKKNIFFQNQLACKKWMEYLKEYKGFNVHEKYELGMRIGAGKYSIVYECKQRQNNKRYAMKEINTFRLTTEEKSIISHESNIMSRFNHPNLIKFRQSITAKNKIFIITELVEGKDLLEFVKEKEVLTEDQASQIAKQIISGVNHMHRLGIVHRDLKPENIMIDSSGPHNLVKIIDFGFANYIKNLEFVTEEVAIIGTPNYIAPEIYRKQKVTEKADIFSIGTIIYFMLSGELPFSSHNLEFLIERTLTEKCRFVGQKWLKVSKESKQLIGKLLQVDPEQRISLKEALSHQWFMNERNGCKETENLSQRKTEIGSISRNVYLY